MYFEFMYQPVGGMHVDVTAVETRGVKGAAVGQILLIAFCELGKELYEDIGF